MEAHQVMSLVKKSMSTQAKLDSGKLSEGRKLILIGSKKPLGPNCREMFSLSKAKLHSEREEWTKQIEDSSSAT